MNLGSIIKLYILTNRKSLPHSDVVLPLPKLEDYYIPTVARIKKAIEAVMKY